MSAITLPAIVPGAVVYSGAVQKQPHGMFSSMRGKQLRFMELKMCDDLTPVLMYYDHPKSDAAVAKGLLILDSSFQGFNMSIFKERKEIEIRSPLESHDPEAVASFVRSFASVVGSDPHIVSDLALAFETSSDYDAWVAALNHALLTDINAEAIATSAPTLILTQVPRPAAPAPEGQVHYEEGFNLCAASHFKDAVKCLGKAVAVKHQLAHAVLSEILYFGRPGVRADLSRSHKLALAGADMGCPHSCGVLALLTVSPLFVTDETDDASDNVQAAKAFELATRSARANSCFGFLALFKFYEKGVGVDENDQVALRYLKLAAAQGYPVALRYLGETFSHGTGVKNDKLEALRLLRLASDQGNVDSQFLLGLMFFDGDGVGCNKMEAARFFRLAADDARAQTHLARMLYNGDGIDQDKAEAVRLYRLAAEQDHAEAQFELGTKYLQGEIEKEPGQFLSQEEKAVKLIRSAARLEHAAALYQYAMWLLEDKLPDGTVLREEEKELFLTFMVAAADQGFANAQGMVAKYYADRRDYARAAEYAEPAAAQGNIDGQFLMGTCILIFVSKGDSSKGSLADAMKFWRSAAEQGDAVSAQLLSETLSVGLKGKFEGFEQDYVEAVKFARMAADQGNVLAQRYLGEYYYSGLGVAQDFAEALRFFRLAAEQGDAPAQLKVGEMYQAGEGASVNLEEGARYCRMAMEQGNTSAHLLYAVLTTNNGVMPDDQGEINRLWMRGAEVGHPHFQLSMAKDKVDEDKDFAVKLCRLAIAQNHAPAMTFLAKLLRSSDGATGADKDEAKKLLEDAWDKDAEAALALGTMYHRGDGVEQDGFQACVMLLQAYAAGLQSEVLAALRAGGFQGSFAQFLRETLPEDMRNMPGVAWSEYISDD